MGGYVLIGFSDGDARVYERKYAEKQISENITNVTRTWLAEGDDRRVLIEMAVLAREASGRGRRMVDMTAEGVNTLEGIYEETNNVR